MHKIRRKDKVKVIYGSQKGAVGTVIKVLPRENLVVVEGVNKIKRHKKNPDNDALFIEKEAPIHISKVALVDKDEKIVRVGFSIKDNIKIRINKKTKEEIK
ncbi:50S ribosomal protein L24 [Candidatus Mycoplasma haematobovis]|uniref:Large ribosomal subunit protein uL24 n=1 Tax=Candidatus Mycoplasma haematobovis TaxID=432608 RepID=A0A1A9QE29_9MOLU|nr:50S ribosomal protein L24 [Candidatus Mycoplasma haematobovis]OAL10374.1 50S ribosomal protein L24 [Candidatus Mycoplasma haematobovis]